MMRNPYPHLIDVMQTAMIVWLRESGEPEAADYFQKQWTGDRGHYMLAHGGHGITQDSSGVESTWRWTKAATSNHANTEFPMFLSNLSLFLKERAREACANHDKLGIPRWTFASKPLISKKTWDKAQEMHPLTLHLSTIVACGRDAQRAYVSAMNSLFEDFDPAEMSLASYLSWKNEEPHDARTPYRIPLRKSLNVVMPSQVIYM
jgi:hypothetical protein